MYRAGSENIYRFGMRVAPEGAFRFQNSFLLQFILN